MFQFNTIEEALEDLRNGKIIVVTDNEDRENYMNNTFTVDSRYNAMNTNTTSTNITCHDTSSFYLKDVPTIKTKIIRFKKKY